MVSQKRNHFETFTTSAYDDVYTKEFYMSENVQLFIASKRSILNIAIFKYSLHKFR